jgi:hypothetical protein
MSPRFRHLLALPLLLVAAPSCNKEGASGKASSSSTSIDGGVASPLGSVPTGDTASGSPLPEATGPSFEGALTMHVTSTLHEPQDITMVTKANKVRVDIPMKNGKAVHSIFDPATGKALVIIDSEKLAMTTVVPAAADMPDLGAPPTVAKTGKHETIAGRDCEDWDVTEALGDKHDQLCVTEGMVFFDFAALTPPNATGASMGTWLKQLRANKEFPLRSVTLDTSGKELSRMEVTKIEAKPVDDALFNWPPGYRQLDMSKMGSMFNPLHGPRKPR